jgi:hypothetical protein
MPAGKEGQETVCPTKKTFLSNKFPELKRKNIKSSE